MRNDVKLVHRDVLLKSKQYICTMAKVKNLYQAKHSKRHLGNYKKYKILKIIVFKSQFLFSQKDKKASSSYEKKKEKSFTC